MFTRRAEAQVMRHQSDLLAVHAHSSYSGRPLTRPSADAPNVNVICQNLTPRQRDVLALLMQAKSNKAICRVLNLAEPTVKNHVTAILKALKATNRTEVVIKVSETAVALQSFASTISSSQTSGRRQDIESGTGKVAPWTIPVATQTLSYRIDGGHFRVVSKEEQGI